MVRISTIHFKYLSDIQVSKNNQYRLCISAKLVERDLQKPYTNLPQDRHTVDYTAFTMCEYTVLLSLR